MKIKNIKPFKQFVDGVSVIVPIYNVEKYLSEACESLLKQKKIDFTLEILLIDNNSTDSSLTIANDYASKYPSIFTVLKQPNQGVSKVRNLGLQIARCKFIMFLDADDYINDQCISSVYSFFCMNENIVDVVAYNRTFFYEPLYDKNGKVLKSEYFREHPRNKMFPKTDVYDLEEHPELVQATLNIAIKNQDNSKKIYFDTSLDYAEDAEYITKIVSQKLKLGFVKEAKYYYRFSHYSTVNKFDSPVSSYQQLEVLMERHFEYYWKNNLAIPQYVQMVALNEYVWRFGSFRNKLYPFHLDKELYQKWEDKLRKIIRSIDDELIMTVPNLDRFHRYSLIDFKKENIKFIFRGNHSAIDFYKNGKIIGKEEKFEVVIVDLTLRNNVFSVWGFIKFPFEDKLNLKLYIEIDNVEHEISTYESSYSSYKRREFSNHFKGFNFQYDLMDIIGTTTLNFYYKIGKSRFEIKSVWWTRSRFLNVKDKLYINAKKGFKLEYKNYMNFEISTISTEQEHEILYRNEKILNENYKNKNLDNPVLNPPINIIKLREIGHKVKIKRIWLYADKPGVIDNGFYQFLHDIQNIDNINRYYIFHDSTDYLNKYLEEYDIQIRQIFDHFILFGSNEHMKLIMQSEIILGAFNGFAEVYPFSSEAYNKLVDCIDAEFIYLQHGVLHAQLKEIYSKERSFIDRIVISSEFERKNLIDNYLYKDEDLLLTGMPRFDLKNKTVEKINRILFAPSWRVSFTKGRTADFGFIIDEEALYHSQYYSGLISIFESEALDNFLEANDLILDIQLHPIFSSLVKKFEELSTPRINIVKNKIPTEKYKIFITDFSSFVFDAVDLKIPIIYYVLDNDEFLAGNHTYRTLDLPLESQFGPIVENISGLISSLNTIVNNGYQPEENYRKRMDRFYSYPSENRKVLYQKIKQISDGFANNGY